MHSLVRSKESGRPFGGRRQAHGRPDLGAANVSAALAQFDKMWTALIPAEQTSLVQPLVARVTVGEAALTVGVVTAGPAARTRGIAAAAFVRRSRAAMGRSLPAGV